MKVTQIDFKREYKEVDAYSDYYHTFKIPYDKWRRTDVFDPFQETYIEREVYLIMQVQYPHGLESVAINKNDMELIKALANYSEETKESLLRKQKEYTDLSKRLYSMQTASWWRRLFKKW